MHHDKDRAIDSSVFGGISLGSDEPIGVFDSGLGGLSVLAKLLCLMPNEQYIFFGDSGNNPYGTKPLSLVKELTWSGVDFLRSRGVKAIVIACNTATSAAIEELREKLDLPVFGIEPAVKPALASNGNGKILIMATPLTVAETKFKRLMESLSGREEIHVMACPGLAEMIECGDAEGIRRQLKELFAGVDTTCVSSVVLGCTHYPLIKDEIESVIGKKVHFYDGSDGLARYVQHVLTEGNLLRGDLPPVAAQIEYHITGEAAERQTLRAKQIVETLLGSSHKGVFP